MSAEEADSLQTAQEETSDFSGAEDCTSISELSDNPVNDVQVEDTAVHAKTVGSTGQWKPSKNCSGAKSITQPPIARPETRYHIIDIHGLALFIRQATRCLQCCHSNCLSLLGNISRKVPPSVNRITIKCSKCNFLLYQDLKKPETCSKSQLPKPKRKTVSPFQTNTGSLPLASAIKNKKKLTENNSSSSETSIPSVSENILNSTDTSTLEDIIKSETFIPPIEQMSKSSSHQPSVVWSTSSTTPSDSTFYERSCSSHLPPPALKTFADTAGSKILDSSLTKEQIWIHEDEKVDVDKEMLDTNRRTTIPLYPVKSSFVVSKERQLLTVETKEENRNDDENGKDGVQLFRLSSDKDASTLKKHLTSDNENAVKLQTISSPLDMLHKKRDSIQKCSTSCLKKPKNVKEKKENLGETNVHHRPIIRSKIVCPVENRNHTFATSSSDAKQISLISREVFEAVPTVNKLTTCSRATSPINIDGVPQHSSYYTPVYTAKEPKSINCRQESYPLVKENQSECNYIRGDDAEEPLANKESVTSIGLNKRESGCFAKGLSKKVSQNVQTDEVTGYWVPKGKELNLKEAKLISKLLNLTESLKVELVERAKEIKHDDNITGLSDESTLNLNATNYAKEHEAISVSLEDEEPEYITPEKLKSCSGHANGIGTDNYSNKYLWEPSQRKDISEGSSAKRKCNSPDFFTSAKPPEIQGGQEPPDNQLRHKLKQIKFTDLSELDIFDKSDLDEHKNNYRFHDLLSSESDTE